jgi:hypothetical protein
MRNPEFILSDADRERMERTATQEAYWRDKAFAEAERFYALAVKGARERFEADLAAAERLRLKRREAAFLRMERMQDGVWNSIQSKNARARIAHFGLALPWAHPSNDMLRAAQDHLRAQKLLAPATN